MLIGTWNVRTMLKLGKLELLIKEMEILGINIVGLSEVRWKDDCHFRMGDNLVVYSGAVAAKRELLLCYWAKPEKA